jgi:hypothetical protein
MGSTVSSETECQSATRHGLGCYETFWPTSLNQPKGMDCERFCLKHCEDWVNDFFQLWPHFVTLQYWSGSIKAPPLIMSARVTDVQISVYPSAQSRAVRPSSVASHSFTYALVDDPSSSPPSWYIYRLTRRGDSEQFEPVGWLSDYAPLMALLLCRHLQETGIQHTIDIRLRIDPAGPNANDRRNVTRILSQAARIDVKPQIYTMPPLKRLWADPARQTIFDADSGLIVHLLPPIRIGSLATRT